MKLPEYKMTLKQWYQHVRVWLLSCPLSDRNPHVYIGNLGESEEECLICGKIITREIDEDEKKLDKRISESLSWMDEEREKENKND
jgi:hypothetical protein